MNTLESILTYKLIAISRGVESRLMPELCASLVRGGIRLMEVTFDHASPEGAENTLACIRAVKSCCGDKLRVGAGTVLSADEARLAAEAGAEYIISPNVNPAVIMETKRLGLISVPGAMTPTEAETAVEAGADLVKLFPAAALGTAYFKAITAPLSHIRFVPTGGITPENLPEFLRLGAVAFGIGGNLISAKKAAAGDFASIENAARAFTEALGTNTL